MRTMQVLHGGAAVIRAALRRCMSMCGAATLWVALTLPLAACGGGGGDSPAYIPPSSKTFTYTITDSAGGLQAGRRVVVVDGQVLGTCSGGSIVSLLHSGDALVTTPGSVTVTFTLGFPGAYVESVYIDVDASNTLSSGDLVWGTNPSDFAGACISSMGSWPQVQSFDWTDDVAVAVGSTTYTGASQPFALAPGGAPAGQSVGRFVPYLSGGY